MDYYNYKFGVYCKFNHDILSLSKHTKEFKLKNKELKLTESRLKNQVEALKNNLNLEESAQVKDFP